MRISLLHPSMEAAELPITGNAPRRAQVWGDGVSLPHPKSPPWAGAGQPGAPLAMHSSCFVWLQKLLAALCHVRGSH